MSTPQITVAIIFVVGFFICLYLYLQLPSDQGED
jgi:hypothetical protein